MSNPFIQLKKDKEKPVLRFHPWIFSGAVLKKDHAITPGTIVDVLDYKGNFLALAFYEEGSIAAKIISFHKANINLEFWTNKLENAKILREQLKVYKNPNNNMFRAFHGEGDFLPGLIIDIYDRVAVMQPHAHGIVQHQSQISEAIQAVYPEIESIYFSQVGAQGNSKKENHLILGKENSIIKVKENDISFWVDIVHGQKTGFFIDQRDNRKILSNYVENKTVLNTFSYTGGFSCYALTCNPKHVISIDLAKNAHT